MRLPTVIVIIAMRAMATSQSVLVTTRPIRNTLKNAAKPIFFDAAARRPDMGVGAPSYTSGAHMWNGTAATLNPKPASTRTVASIATESEPSKDENAPSMAGPSADMLVVPATP